MPPASNKPHSAGKYSGLASNLAHLGRMRLSPGLGSSCRMANDVAAPASSRSSYRQGRRKAPSGSSFTAQSKAPSGEQPTEPAALGRASCRTSTIGKQLHSAKQGTFGMSILPNQQHREEHFLANNGAKWAGAEGVRGSNLACFLENFVSNYIVIFYIMLFRVHL